VLPDPGLGLVTVVAGDRPGHPPVRAQHPLIHAIRPQRVDPDQDRGLVAELLDGAGQALVADHFKDLAATLARRGGRSALRRHVLPYPLDTLQEAEVRDIARAQYRPFLRTLGL